jgi:hypothetical protein
MVDQIFSDILSMFKFILNSSHCSEMSRMIRAFFASFFAPVALAFMPGSETAPQKANNLNAVSICQHLSAFPTVGSQLCWHHLA